MGEPSGLAADRLATRAGRDDARTALVERGYLVVRGALGEPELRRLRGETEAHLARIDEGRAEPLVREEDGTPFRVENIAAYPILDRSVLAARTSPLLLDAMAEMLGADVVSYGSVMVFKLPAVGPAVPMHRDIAEGVFHPDHAWYAAGIYLDDSTVDNGCLWVVPGSHRTVGAELAELSERGFDAPGAVPVPVPAGSVLLHDSRLLHGSRPSAGGRLRRVLYHSYQSAQWMLREGLKRSFRPDDRWVAESLRLMAWGLALRGELGYADPPAAWRVPERWRAATDAVVPRDDLAAIRYRVTDPR